MKRALTIALTLLAPLAAAAEAGAATPALYVTNSGGANLSQLSRLGNGLLAPLGGPVASEAMQPAHVSPWLGAAEAGR